MLFNDEFKGVPKVITGPCGNTAYFENECGYRCGSCFAVLGSVGMPRDCYDLYKEVDNDRPSKTLDRQ